MTWNDTLRTGNPTIDAQHEELCWLTDELAGAREKGNLAAALEFLLNYTRTHFSDEEAYMESIGFTELAEHRQKHRYFVETVMDYQERSDRRQLDFKTLLDFLTKWLVEHIQEEDIPMVRGSATWEE